ncbi:MAG: ABC transporter ATP-binding protein [Bacteroidales bacterium]|nr:ABC transporter ATP-binding protein [Bacteroidales bacterium]
MIQLDNVQFGYAKNQLLFNGVTWHFEQGHFYGLLGRNGAGKTTLLKIMTGLLFPQNGEAKLEGMPSYKRTTKQLQNVYFLQEEIYVPHLKIKEFEDAYAPFYPDFSHEQFSEYLREFEMDNMLGFIDKFSHGQKKKVMIAFALATNVPLLIMDEPTNGLDIPSKSTFRKIMASYADEQKTVLISTHQVRDLHSLIDAVSIIDNGRMILNAPADVITDKLLFDIDNEKAQDGKVFYTEETPRGIYQVKENLNHVDSALDLELLFNAAVQNKKEFTELFQ